MKQQKFRTKNQNLKKKKNSWYQTEYYPDPINSYFFPIDIKPDMEIWKQIETFKAKTTDRSFSIVSNMAQKGSTDDEAANTK